jgi:hypothetical protein
MKAFLLKCVAALLISGLIFSACKKGSQSLESKGVIYKTPGIVSTCNACWSGLYYIKFTSDTTIHYIDNNIRPLGFLPTMDPVNVSVNWKPDNTAGKNYVTITALKLEN